VSNRDAQLAAFDKKVRGRGHVIQNICYGDRALVQTLYLLCMRILSKRRPNRHVEADWAQCVEAEQMQCKKNILKYLLAAVLHKNKRNAAGNSKNVAHPWSQASTPL